jgi:putative transposase
MLADRRYCYPLTISDFASRYLFSCEALASTKETYAFTIFEQVVKDFGLPTAIRTDNGVPFASPHALFGLSKLAVWWLRLGIRIERIKPGHPAQNGRHERIHLTLKKEPPSPRLETSSSSRPASTSSSTATTTSAPTRRST